MNSLVFVVFSIIFLSATAVSQSVCKEPPDEAILTICKSESGMMPSPQPQLMLRVYADGRTEYEQLGGPTGLTLLKSKVSANEIDQLDALGRSPDFLKAKDAYPAFTHRTDSSSLTTVTFKSGDKQKRITLANFYVGDPNNKGRYPRSLVALMKLAIDIREKAMGVVRPVPAITFCELIKNHREYLGEKVSIYANLEYHANIMANLQVRNENAVLYDPECDSPAMGQLRTTVRIGAGFVGTDPDVDALKEKVRELSDYRFNGRARVMATGVLVDERKRPLDTFDFTFNLIELKNIQPIVLPYQGKLELGWTYSDTIDYVKAKGLQLSAPLKPLLHQAARIEWRGENNFPALDTDGRKHIVFRVNSSVTQPMTANRWDVTYNCEIIEVN